MFLMDIRSWGMKSLSNSCKKPKANASFAKESNAISPVVSNRLMDASETPDLSANVFREKLFASRICLTRSAI